MSIKGKAQIRDLIVEKYYISDSLDATDSTNFLADPTYPTKTLLRNSNTYRVYVQIDSGYKIHKIYGTVNHPLKLISTANFFNNIDRPDEYFGYLIKKQYFSNNPTFALDSWLTLGLCAKSNTMNYVGVTKSDDHDGSFLATNGGGTSGIANGILNNIDASTGIPLDSADGMIPTTDVYLAWVDNGIKDAFNVDTTVLGSVNVGSRFVSTNGYLQMNTGVSGDSITGHKVLVAQLTTQGELTLELNIELIYTNGTGIHYLNFVANNNGLPTTGDTLVNTILKYPPLCGCKDPNYLEYNATYGCANQDSCIHKIVFGCMDTSACNYDPHVNFNIQSLCCYPGKCNDRDISLVCPSLSLDNGFSLYPNPAIEQLTLQISAGNSQPVKYEIYDSFGTLVLQKDLGVLSGVVIEEVEISNLHVGLYLVRVYEGTATQSKTFMKN